jgi:hypothetical protein
MWNTSHLVLVFYMLSGFLRLDLQMEHGCGLGTTNNDTVQLAKIIGQVMLQVFLYSVG